MIIGMAGGVGSGKSTVLSILKQYEKVRICMADELGHQAMEQGTKAYEKIVAHFGKEICDESGAINRTRLGKLYMLMTDSWECSMRSFILSCGKRLPRRQQNTERTICFL